MADIVTTLTRQLDCSLDMLGQGIDLCPDEAWTDDRRHAPVWEQLYHALFWFGAWLRDWSIPMEYPEFHISEALDIKGAAGAVISKAQLRSYLAKVRADYAQLVAALTPESLLVPQEAFGRPWTMADRILGQIRHVQHHVGYLNAVLSATRGVRVHWIGYGE